jgi:hypothetical protein
MRRGFRQEAWATLNTADRRFVSSDAMARRIGGPKSALEFFNAMSEDERSLGAWYEAGKAHVSLDTEAASQWMESLPRGPERDAAATALVEQLTQSGAEQDGEAAFAWAASMSGSTERARYMAQAAQAWALEDAAAARAAVSAANLPQAEKHSLLRRLPKGGEQ